MEVRSHAQGRFCWAELHTSASAAAKTYYTSLFGWAAHDDEMAPGMVYTIYQLQGKNACAMYEDHESGAPPFWANYIAVDDADALTARAKELGGKVDVGPFDAHDLGRMSVLQDPQGAYFSIWQAKKAIGAQVIDEPGAPCWNELNTTDPVAAFAFYSGLLGWTTNETDIASAEYTEFHVGGAPIGGIMRIKPEWGPVPPNWLVYFQVSDCFASGAKAVELGGKALVGPMAMEDHGLKFAVIQDPQGAVFGMVELTGKA